MKKRNLIKQFNNYEQCVIGIYRRLLYLHFVHDKTFFDKKKTKLKRITNTLNLWWQHYEIYKFNRKFTFWSKKGAYGICPMLIYIYDRHTFIMLYNIIKRMYGRIMEYWSYEVLQYRTHTEYFIYNNTKQHNMNKVFQKRGFPFSCLRNFLQRVLYYMLLDIHIRLCMYNVCIYV